MKTIASRKTLAYVICNNIRWYNQQAKQHNQGALSSTWVKYVAKLKPSQWKDLKQGSSSLPLHTYHKTLDLIQTMEETVLGKTYQNSHLRSRAKPQMHHSLAAIKSKNNDPMRKAKENMQKMLAGIKQRRSGQPKAKADSSINKAKHNMMKVLGTTQPKPRKRRQVITMIKAQRQKNRFNVYVNGRYAFPAGVNELTRYHLTVGMPITNHLKKVIRESSDVSKMFARASTRIVHHLRTEHEIREWLHKKYDCSAKDIDRVVKMLKDYHLINDAHYSHEYIRAEIISGSKGPLAIGRHLRSKGVSDLTVQTVLEQVYPLDKQLSVAEHQAKDKFKIKSNVPFVKRMRKIKQALVRKGFSFEVATDAVNECHFKPDESQQKRLLEKYTKQAFRRYDRGITPNNHYKIRMKIKRFLFRKGFNFDTIDQAIEKYK